MNTIQIVGAMTNDYTSLIKNGEVIIQILIAASIFLFILLVAVCFAIISIHKDIRDISENYYLANKDKIFGTSSEPSQPNVQIPENRTNKQP